MKQVQKYNGQCVNGEYIDTEYRFGSVKVGEFIELAPGVKVKLVNETNNLCPSNYNKNIVCFWEGDLSLYFSVNGKEYRINDHDTHPNSITHGTNSINEPVNLHKSTFSLNNIEYSIYGAGYKVNNMSRNETYIKYRITRNENICLRRIHKYSGDRI